MRSFTIVIPIYNSENTLEKCIDSILGQTWEDFELLLIDDGSTDASAQICDDYAKKDDRIRIIHRGNKGLVSGRKLGAKEATGKYIAFVDSDDWMEPDAFEKMMQPICEDSTTDLVITSMIMDRGGKQNLRRGTVLPGRYKNDDISNVIDHMMYQWDKAEFGVLGSVCGKIYDRDLFAQIENRVDDRITYGEDDALVYTLIPKCNNICILDEAFYHYCNNSGTMSTCFSLGSFEKLKILSDHFENTFKEYGLWPKLRDGVHQIVGMFMYLALANLYGLNVGHQFPFDKIPYGSRVVLYGAGAVGKDYYHALRGSGYATIVAWVDSDHDNKKKEGWDVSPVDNIDDIDYDMVIICVEAGDVAETIKESLIKRGVSSDKIFRETPRFIYA